MRLFKERLTLILELAGAEGDGGGTESEAGLRGDTVALLRKQVANMNIDNFLVRTHRRWVELYRDEAPWLDLDLERAIELADRVADLPSTEDDDDEEAKRFDLIILKLQLCRLLREPGAPSPSGPGDRVRLTRGAVDSGDPRAGRVARRACR
jgi:type I restriction enzyme, R subunit